VANQEINLFYEIMQWVLRSFSTIKATFYFKAAWTKFKITVLNGRYAQNN
jgi:hypothetical protein